MMARADDVGRYRIVDEPQPSPLARFAMNPIIPFFAFMLFGAAGGLLFIFNAVALAGPTRWREIGLAAAAITAKDGLRYLMVNQWPRDAEAVVWLDYALVLPVVLGLWLGYRVFLLQARSWQIRQFLNERRSRT